MFFSTNGRPDLRYGTYAGKNELAPQTDHEGEPLRPRTKELYENELHILPVFGDLPIGKITTARVRAWSSKMRGPNGPGPSTAAKCYRLLRAMLGTAVEDGLIAMNPCTIKGAGKEPESKRPIVPVAQAFELADLVDPRFRSIFLLAAFVGLRKGEMLGLRRRDLDFDAALVDIGQQRQLSRNGSQLVGPPKTDAGIRQVSIPSALLDDLRMRRASSRAMRLIWMRSVSACETSRMRARIDRSMASILTILCEPRPPSPSGSGSAGGLGGRRG